MCQQKSILHTNSRGDPVVIISMRGQPHNSRIIITAGYYYYYAGTLMFWLAMVSLITTQTTVDFYCMNSVFGHDSAL